MTQQQVQVEGQQRILAAITGQQASLVWHLTSRVQLGPRHPVAVPLTVPLAPQMDHGPPIHMSKMGPEDDTEAYLNTFEQAAMAAAWPMVQRAAILTLCLTGVAQEAVDTLTATEAADYTTIQATTLQ